MQRWLKRITPDRHALEKHLVPEAIHHVGQTPRLLDIHAHQRGTRAFASVCSSPSYRRRRCRCISLLCALLGVLFRLNLPVLFATVFLSNPFTWLPQVVGSMWVGAKLMGMDLMPARCTQHQPTAMHWTQLGQLWPPLLLGALVLGLAAPRLGYVLAQGVWRAARHPTICAGAARAQDARRAALD